MNTLLVKVIAWVTIILINAAAMVLLAVFAPTLISLSGVLATISFVAIVAIGIE